MPTEEVTEWVALVCPVCGGTCFDGQGHDSRGRYIHRCPDCNTQIRTPADVGTTHPEDPAVDGPDVVRITETHMERGTREFTLTPGETVELPSGVHLVAVDVAPFDTDDEDE